MVRTFTENEKTYMLIDRTWMYGSQYTMSLGNPIEETTKLSSQGKTTIPKPMRQYLGLEKGDEIHFETQDDGTVTIEKVE